MMQSSTSKQTSDAAMNFVRAAWLLVVALTAFGSPDQAKATSGPGCLYVVNVASWDALNMRARPSARSGVVDRLKPNGHGIIKLNAPCIPLNRPWGERWCSVTHYNGYATRQGWVKARYVRDSDCP